MCDHYYYYYHSNKQHHFIHNTDTHITHDLQFHKSSHNEAQDILGNNLYVYYK